MSLEDVKATLLPDSVFGYRGKRDVSLILGGQQAQPQNATRQPSSAASAGGERDMASLRNLNPFCIAGCILTILSLFLIYLGIPALAALVVSAIGFYEAKKAGRLEPRLPSSA